MSPTPPRRARRRAIVAGTALTMLFTGGTISAAAPATATSDPAGTSTARISTAKPAPGLFRHPSAAARPMYRFWHTGGLMTPDSVARQVAQIKASGAGGFEANQLTKVVETAPGYDAVTMGWGTPSWTNAQRALF